MSYKKKDVVSAAKELRQRADKLSAAALELYQKADKQAKDEIPEEVLKDERVKVLDAHSLQEGKWQTLAQALNVPADGATTDFAEFLTSTGAALVATQRQLDVESKAYLEAISKVPHLLPAVFRIPKLSGEMKFALERVAGTKLSLVFYGKEEKKTALNQQSMSFEIVSAPPPPDFFQKLQSLAPRLDLVLSLPQREQILEVISDSDLEAKMLPKELMKERQDELLMTSAMAPGEDPKPQYFVLFANEDEEKLIGVWHGIGILGLPRWSRAW